MIANGLVLALFAAPLAAQEIETAEAAASAGFVVEYLTSADSVLLNDGIVVHVVNDSAVTASTRVVIYKNTGAGAVTIFDSGSVNVVATWTWGVAHNVSQSGEYWVRVQASSESLIPKVSFERFTGGVWTPVVTYRPGDFAIFSIPRQRLW
jgi:hypothetical protein